MWPGELPPGAALHLPVSAILYFLPLVPVDGLGRGWACDHQATLLVFNFLVPKTEVMIKRLGSFVDEFKELVYPPDYNPEGKVTKRKQSKQLLADVQWLLFFFCCTAQFTEHTACVFT